MLYKKKSHKTSSIITINKKAYHNYRIEETFQSGLVLQGWEVKSIREGQVNISESYVRINLNEMYLYNAIIQPLYISLNHILCNSTRERKLLLHKKEIDFLSIKQKKIGYTLIALSLFWKKSWCKLEFGLAKGKKIYDKRTDIKQKEWNKEKLKIIKKFL